MKKYTAIVLMLLLCFTLLGCEKPQEPVGETPVIDTQAPETVTPNEVVTPSEVEPEVVTPNEPETPVEPEVPTEPEQPAEQPEENVIILPPPDEDTVKIVLEIPQDFIDKPYEVCTMPELTAPEDFEWGEYLPFVSVTPFRIEQSPPHFAILSDECRTFNDGMQLYEKVNQKYLIEYSGQKNAKEISPDISEEYLDFLYKSRIVYISSDTSVIGRFQLTPDNDHWRDGNWDGNYDIIKENNVVHSEFCDTEPPCSTLVSGTQLYSNTDTALKKYYGYKEEFVSFNGVKSEAPWNRSAWVIFKEYMSPQTDLETIECKSKFVSDNVSDMIEDIYGVIYYIYSSDGSKLLYTVETIDTMTLKLENGQAEQYSIFYSFIDETQIIVSVTKNLFDNYKDFYYSPILKSTQSVYLYDLNKREMKYVSGFAYYPSISPDGEYLIYNAPFEYVGTSDEFDPAIILQDGFYIKNLTKSTTVFFEYDRQLGDDPNCISWVDKHRLREIIE